VYFGFFLFHFFKKISIFFLCFALWGAFLCRLICLIQADLKALVAYSSIRHIGVIIVGVFCNILRGVKGFIIIIVAHAFCSSALFFLVGYHYERRTRRQVILSRGFRILSYFMGVYWFFFLRANFAAPPFIRLLGELSIFISLIFFRKVYFICLRIY